MMADDPRAHLPSLTALLERDEVGRAIAAHGRDAVLDALRGRLAQARQDLGVDRRRVPEAAEIAATALARLDTEEDRALRAVINATGVVLHTNLGRAQLSAAAVEAVVRAARATNLELDLASGDRGGRGSVVHQRLARLCGAEAALAVNNGAAALVLALSVLARDREVVISRGELVEIGGSFRLPEVMASAGVVLHEIGTTNRTHLDDYRRALGPRTGAVLRVHPSNYEVSGFVHRPTAAEIAGATGAAGVPFLYDVGSGLLADHPVAPDEPTAAGALAAGADLVVFSGDKLLGGPQAGAVVGRADLVERCRRDPLARALRLDKLRMAALEATLASHARGELDELPTFALATADPQQLRERAEGLAVRCGGRVVAVDGVLGGGAAPHARLPSFGVAVPGPAEELAARLRTGRPAVVARVVDDEVVADLRSVPADLDDQLGACLERAVEGGGG